MRKTTTAKVLLTIPYFLIWVLYFLLTMDARGRYLNGKAKGMHCYTQSNGLSSTTYYFDVSKKPEREYLTWKEFWQQRGY